MTLPIRTFSNTGGGNVAYKALAHPLAGEAATGLWRELAQFRRLGIYDPEGLGADVAALYPFDPLPVAAVYVQQLEATGTPHVAGLPALPVSALAEAHLDALLIVSFDSERHLHQLGRMLDPDWRVYTLAALRIPDDWLSDRRRYLSPVNFVTNLVFFRDADGLHTRLGTFNYWSRYGAAAPCLQGLLYGSDGRCLLRFQQPLAVDGAPLVIDSQALREQHGLDAFCGQLFVHLTGAAGHDVFKYALDTWSDDGASLSATHDANAWPADRYAGLPTPRDGERVDLWLQNSHPVTVPAGAVALRDMHGEVVARLESPLAPWATRCIEVPAAGAQVELLAGKHVVRPRYEVVSDSRRRIAHLNVVREDLQPDGAYRRHREQLGRGYILSAPVLDPALYRTELLVTPMSPAQQELGLVARVHAADGRLWSTQPLSGRRPHEHRWVDVAELATELAASGHLELSYDHDDADGQIDGWLHAIFRYTHRASGHAAETSFGSHLFNTIVTWRNEPQSYAGPPPGLSTRLFVRTAPGAFVHLIYPTSTDWHEQSTTRIELHDRKGGRMAQETVSIPLRGSLHLELEALFGAAAVAAAGYAIVRDSTCRLFGYHGIKRAGGAFSLDHLFGA